MNWASSYCSILISNEEENATNNQIKIAFNITPTKPKQLFPFYTIIAMDIFINEHTNHPQRRELTNTQSHTRRIFYFQWLNASFFENDSIRLHWHCIEFGISIWNSFVKMSWGTVLNYFQLILRPFLSIVCFLSIYLQCQLYVSQPFYTPHRSNKWTKCKHFYCT